MTPGETRRAQQQERDDYYAQRYDNPEAIRFAQFVGDEHVCKTCWAVMVDAAKHEQWHQDLTAR